MCFVIVRHADGGRLLHRLLSVSLKYSSVKHKYEPVETALYESQWPVK